MRIARKAKRLLRNVLRRDGAEHSLDEELQAFVDDLTRRNAARGMAPEEARRAALMETGGMARVKEDVREAWLGHWIETTLQDVRLAFRSLRRAPGFTAVVAATLALGIGANLTMFSLMRAVFWRPLPYPQPDRIVTIEVDARNVPYAGATVREILGLRERSRTLEQVATISQVDANLDYGGEMEHVAAASVSDDFLPLLGARPELGRALDSRIDEGKNQVLAILISDALWRRRFGADPRAIGRSVRVNNLQVQIAGVLPAGFRLFMPPTVTALEQIDVWFPTALGDPGPYRGNPVLARLRPGATRAQANAELKTFLPQFAREEPKAYAGGTVQFMVEPLHEEMTRSARPALFLLAAAVGFVLLIACANAANLMLARGAARRRELEIRRALGAGRTRIARQLLTESLVLATASAAVGLGCARLGLGAIGLLSASHIPLQTRIRMDLPVALGAVALAAATSLLFGLLPAWRLTAGRTAETLRAGRGDTAGASARSLQRALVAAEVALSIVPLVGGGLMLRSFVNLLHAPLGFHSEDVVTAAIRFDMRRYQSLEQRWALLRDIVTRVQALPGVEQASAANPLPLAGDQETRRVGRTDLPEASPILATQQVALPGYLGAIGTPLREGRDFSDGDVAAERNVTIVDEVLARRLWPEGAIGKRLAVFRTGRRDDLEVIGVTAPVRVTSVRDGNVPHFVIPYSLYPIEMSLVLKTRQSAELLAGGIQAAVKAAQTGRAAFNVRPMSGYVADSVGDTRFVLWVLAAFAGASVLLAAVGLYGTLAYLTARRTREFGIRLALGSSMRAIVGIVMRESIALAAAGTAAGVLGAAAVTGAMRGLLYEVGPLDAATLAGVAGLVGLVAVIAASGPAWRATRTDPQASLRSE